MDISILDFEIVEYFQKLIGKLLKMHYFSRIFKIFNKRCRTFSVFEGGTQVVAKFRESFEKFDEKCREKLKY